MHPLQTYLPAHVSRFDRDVSHATAVGGKDVPSMLHGARRDYGEGSQTYALQSLLTVSGYMQLWIHQK